MYQTCICHFILNAEWANGETIDFIFMFFDNNVTLGRKKFQNIVLPLFIIQRPKVFEKSTRSLFVYFLRRIKKLN